MANITHSDPVVTESKLTDFYTSIKPYLGGSVSTGFTPIGTIIAVMGNSAPANFLACNGQVVNIADYKELANYFFTQFGSYNYFGGDGTTTFGIPDLRGEFLRGTGTNSHTGNGDGANVGVHQDATLHHNDAAIHIEETGTYVGGQVYSSYADSNFVTNADTNTNTNANTWITPATISLQSNDSPGTLKYTSRPTNTSVLYCIATKNMFMSEGSNYSTDEQVVGTWINGKPIYQKTIDFGYLPNNTVKTVAHNISNLDWVVDAKGIAYNGSGGYRSIPILYNTTYASYNTAFLVRLADIQLEVNNDMSAFYAYITIQYTKTTD